MPGHVRDGSVWKEMNEVHVRDGSVWKEVMEGYVRDGSLWKQWWAAATEVPDSLLSYGTVLAYWNMMDPQYMGTSTTGPGGVSNGSLVAFVQDLSGNDRHLTQSSSSDRPTYDGPNKSLQFGNGQSNYLESTGGWSTSGTYQWAIAGSNQFVGNFNIFNTILAFQSGFYRPLWNLGGRNQRFTLPTQANLPAYTGSGASSMRAARDGNATMRRATDGIQTTVNPNHWMDSAYTQLHAPFYVGGRPSSNNSAGRIHQIIIYDNNLSTAQMENLTTDLNIIYNAR